MLFRWSDDDDKPNEKVFETKAHQVQKTINDRPLHFVEVLPLQSAVVNLYTSPEVLHPEGAVGPGFL
jgi:hypothetical protein